MSHGIQLGLKSDKPEYLLSLVINEAKRMCSTLDLAVGEKKEIPFWTNLFPELIAVVTFEKKSTGEIIYEIDDTQSTL